MDAAPERIAAAAAEVKQAGLKLYGGGVIGLHTPAQVAQAFEYGKAAGMSKLIIMPSPEMLPLVNEKVRQYDIVACIHNHGPGDKSFPTPQIAYEAIRGLDRRLGLCIDIGHTVRAGADLLEATEHCADRLFDMHMKDVTGATAKAREIEVGRGVIDIPRCCVCW